MRHRGFSTYNIQIGPFAACWADFVPKMFHLFPQPPIINHFSLPFERGRKEGAGAENKKRELYKSDTGVSVLGASKLDHSQ